MRSQPQTLVMSQMCLQIVAEQGFLNTLKFKLISHSATVSNFPSFTKHMSFMRYGLIFFRSGYLSLSQLANFEFCTYKIVMSWLPDLNF